MARIQSEPASASLAYRQRYGMCSVGSLPCQYQRGARREEAAAIRPVGAGLAIETNHCCQGFIVTPVIGLFLENIRQAFLCLDDVVDGSRVVPYVLFIDAHRVVHRIGFVVQVTGR